MTDLITAAKLLKEEKAFVEKFKLLLFILFSSILILLLLKKYVVVIISILLCSSVMLHKRYLSVSLGIDYCLIFIMLASSKFGTLAGILVSSSFLIGMVLSFQISRNPMMTIYGSIFYAVVAIIYSFMPISYIYASPLLHVIIISIPFTIGAFLVGAPVEFLIRYIPTNIMTNLLFMSIFGGLLRLVF